MTKLSLSYMPQQKGPTLADTQTYENLNNMLTNRFEEGAGDPEVISISELIPGYTSGLSNLPIRTATNSMEHYGGMRMDGIAGAGDVVCRTEDMQRVRVEILNGRRQRVRDVLALVTSRPDDFVVEFDSHIVDRFLELYDQPLPGVRIRPLNLPEPKIPYRDPSGYAAFERMGVRDKVWAEGPALSQLRMEGEYASKKFHEWQEEYKGRRDGKIDGNADWAKQYCREYSRGYSVED